MNLQLARGNLALVLQFKSSVSQPMGRDPVTGRGRFPAGCGTFSKKYKMSLNGQIIGYFVI